MLWNGARGASREVRPPSPRLPPPLKLWRTSSADKGFGVIDLRDVFGSGAGSFRDFGLEVLELRGKNFRMALMLKILSKEIPSALVDNFSRFYRVKCTNMR